MSGVALFVIIFLLVALTALIVFLGCLPGKIARSRNHPCVDAINAASWIGLVTGVFWPIAFIWAYCPFPSPNGGSAADSDSSVEVQQLRERLASLEASMAKLQKTRKAGA